MISQNVAVIPQTHYIFTEDDPDMADLGAQHDLAGYLEDLLKLLYSAKGWYVTGNMYILERSKPRIAPDVFMAKVNIAESQRPYVTSWNLSEPNRPIPAIVFEIASDQTFSKDLDEKVERYRDMGVQEYFAYDPTMPEPIWHDKNVRLKGWKFVNKIAQAPKKHSTQPDWMWSEVLQRWLAPAMHEIHLYNDNGQRELTREELRVFNERRAEEETARAERERDARERAERRADTQQQRAEQLAKEKADAERRAAENEARIEVIRQKLREQGLNPDDIL